MLESSRSVKRCLTALLFLAFASTASAQPEPQWVRVFGVDLNDCFTDIYLTADGNYAMCGNKVNGHSDDWWFLKTDGEGRLITQQQYGDAVSIENAQTLIELDNSDFLIGGLAQDNGVIRFRVIRIDADGDPIWGNFYGEPRGNCYSVIELKDGNLLAAGYTRFHGDSLIRPNDNGYLIKLNGQGDVIWEFQYGEGGVEYFYSMKEIDDGVILAGRTGSGAWLVKVDEDGGIIWERFFERFDLQTPLSEMFSQIINCREGGWLVVGILANLQAEGNPSEYWAMRLSAQGESIWERRYDLGSEGHARWLGCAIEAPNGDYLMVGEGPSNNGHGEAIILRTDHDGIPSWHRMIGQEWGDYWAIKLNSILFAPDGGAICAGWGGLPGGQAQGGGMLVKLPFERTQPLITEITPDTTELTVLTGDTVMFSVVAADAQMDSLLREWRRNDSLISVDTTIFIHFPEVGDEIIRCCISDGNEADSVAWSVHVRDFFITSYQPDTLDLCIKRGVVESFSVEVAAVEGALVGYDWALTDLSNFEQSVVSDNESFELQLNRCGSYSLSALATYGEASDEVVWSVSVRSAIFESFPAEELITATIDTTLDFEIVPFNPDSDSLQSRWFLDDHEIGDGLTANVAFRQYGVYFVKATLSDGTEGDSAEWRIEVNPDAVGRSTITPVEFDFSVAPNPFNGSTTVRLSLPVYSDVTLSLYDLSGRIVAVPVVDRFAAGVHSIPAVFPNLPDGVYVIHLQVNDAQISRKCVLLR